MRSSRIPHVVVHRRFFRNSQTNGRTFFSSSSGPRFPRPAGKFTMAGLTMDMLMKIMQDPLQQEALQDFLQTKGLTIEELIARKRPWS